MLESTRAVETLEPRVHVPIKDLETVWVHAGIDEEIVEETDYCNMKVSLEDSVGALQLCLLNFSKMEWWADA